MKERGFEVIKGWENKKINLPIRKTELSAGYDTEAAEQFKKEAELCFRIRLLSRNM